MAIWDLFKAKAEVERRAQGHISDLRVEKGGEHERWFIGLDSRPGEWFVFEPSPLSPQRRRGDAVVIEYSGPSDPNTPHPVEQISAA